MVRAILEGRKTQTRRIVKPQTAVLTDAMARALDVRPPSHENMPVIPCPYGNPGDRLWVRETFHTSLIGDAGTAITYKSGPETTNEEPWHNFTSSVEAYEWTAQKYKKHWMPSIHMPRWASRIDLEVTGVRVERLQDISEEDAIAEGGAWTDTGKNEWGQQNNGWSHCGNTHADGCLLTARHSFWNLWNKINGPGSWERNEWVWVVEFKRIMAEKKAQEIFEQELPCK